MEIVLAFSLGREELQIYNRVEISEFQRSLLFVIYSITPKRRRIINQPLWKIDSAWSYQNYFFSIHNPLTETLATQLTKFLYRLSNLRAELIELKFKCREIKKKHFSKIDFKICWYACHKSRKGCEDFPIFLEELKNFFDRTHSTMYILFLRESLLVKTKQRFLTIYFLANYESLKRIQIWNFACIVKQ